MGVTPTTELVEALRTRVQVLGARTPEHVRALLRDELLAQVGTTTDRTLATHQPRQTARGGARRRRQRHRQDHDLRQARPGPHRRRAHASCSARPTRSAPPLPTSSRRGGRGSAPTPCAAPKGATRPRVAFDAVKRGIAEGVDVVLIDTAGRLHTKSGLMDELGKVKRVVEKHGPVDEVLLVLDATTGQNAIVQARVFTEVVDVTGIVLTKLDGTAKGGIVVAVQRELGVPVKLVGLGEGPDDLAPFEPEAFVDALLGAEQTA